MSLLLWLSEQMNFMIKETYTHRLGRLGVSRRRLE
uniref:Uncharacterized protein n=1 Tax=Steinernema glaseri TaxID=37863 RepID=A0A1I7Y397_9BILA